MRYLRTQINSHASPITSHTRVHVLRVFLVLVLVRISACDGIMMFVGVFSSVLPGLFLIIVAMWPIIGSYLTTGLKQLLQISVMWALRGAALLVGVRLAVRCAFKSLANVQFPDLNNVNPNLSHALLVATTVVACFLLARSTSGIMNSSRRGSGCHP